ncbi:MAG: hypothetical protein IIU45_03065, partial [Lachnospiraceae bacterium]|jgi:hypothetical protein|nr:hypothetical protein [Lachnospiraceae bacterium]MBQ5375829.1 hypothetical protein [Lachnospiraceae bacterium]MBR1849472.1 hypothetical protein [Lachnospiraceae bacterium]
MENYDFDRLRKELENSYGAQSVTFSGGFGFLEMLEAGKATEEQLLDMARREGVNLEKFKIN